MAKPPGDERRDWLRNPGHYTTKTLTLDTGSARDDLIVVDPRRGRVTTSRPSGNGRCGHPLLRFGAQFPRLHAECIRKASLQRNAGWQRAPPYGHLGDLAVKRPDAVRFAPNPVGTVACTYRH